MTRDYMDTWRVLLANSGWPPVWCAACIGDVNELSKLLAGGEDPNAAGGKGTSPLQIAAIEGHPKAIELLLAHGADPNRLDLHGNGPLWAAVHHACLAKRTDDNLAVVSLLLAGGADPDHVNRAGRSPRAIALQRDKTVAALFSL